MFGTLQLGRLGLGGPALQRRLGLRDKITASRAGVGWDTDLNGVIREFGAGVPRITGSGANERLLVHEAVNQLLEQPVPTDISDYTVRSGGVTLVAADILGIASAVEFPASGATEYAYQAYGSVDGSDYTFSVYVEMEDGLPPNFSSATVSSVGNTFLLTAASTARNPLFYEIADFGNGRYRVSYTGTLTSGANFGVLQYNTNEQRSFKVTGYNLTKTSYLAPPALTQGTAPADIAQLNARTKSQMYDLGPELWTGAGVTLGAGWADNGDGSYTCDGSQTSTSYLYTPILTVGKYYRVSFQASGLSGSIYLIVGNLGSNYLAIDGSNSTIKQCAGNSNCIFYAPSGASGTISNISVREVIPCDFTMVVDFTTPEDWDSRQINIFTAGSISLYSGASDGVLKIDDGTTETTISTLSNSTRYRVAIGVDADGGIRASVNGGSVVTGSTDISGLGAETVYLGSDGSDYFLDEHFHAGNQVIRGTDTDAKLQARATL